MSPSSIAGPGGLNKRAVRGEALARRDAISAAERAIASERIGYTAAELIIVRVEIGVVGLYAAKASEVETAILDAELRAAGFAIAYPRIVAGERRLAFHLATPGDLVPTARGLREPRADAPAIDAADIAVFGMPGLAFDRGGGRLGWGQGHYDVTLQAAPAAFRLGLAFASQVIAEVPREPHDVMVHAIATEAGIIEVGA